MTTTVAREELDRLVGGAHHDPHGVLGAHPMPGKHTVIRTLRPEASAVAVIVRTHPARPCTGVHDGGVFEAVLDGEPSDYRLEVTYHESDHRSTTRTASCPRSARSTCT